ncbi:hypothetical protein [Streptomyces lanatus]|uniref:Uncharacterized protein n=1 Tax=Streptomyces lanatus TaxID=66900 RepID=A0ABV1XPQ9_9ACTN|nr:hypothetical protein [Streptomyces lanatus]GHG87618.1 hypothetical protein GCM10018780_05290 [Streptomyces lanatus]
MAADSPTVLISVTLWPGATLRDAVRRLRLAEDEVDTAYGLVLVDPARHLYALLVTQSAGERLRGIPGAGGPYANPRIEPFGPPRPENDND